MSALNTDDRLEKVADSAWFPILLGTVSSLLFLWIWRSLDAVAPIHDEGSFLFQAKLFARWHWTAPSPPVPEFFQPMYVLTTPVYASMYFPGQPLTLVPGLWLRLPGLMPIVLLGISGALTFSLGRRLAGAATGLLAWAVWTTAPVIPWFRPSYLSELTTAACILIAWSFALAWRDRSRRAALVFCSFVVAWGAITRPLTMLLLAAPLGAALLPTVVRRRAWGDVLTSLGAGVLVLSLLPIWCLRTSGSLRRIPYDMFGDQFAKLDPGTPDYARSMLKPNLSPDLERVMRELRRVTRNYESIPLWAVAGQRIRAIGKDMFLGNRLWELGISGWAGWRLAMLPFFFAGFFFLPREGWLAVASAVSLFVGQLWYWHIAEWTKYYIELLPVLAFLVALGVRGVCSRFVARRARGGVLCASAAVVLLASLPALRLQRSEKILQSRDQDRFRLALRSLPDRRSVVFVRYAPNHDMSHSLIENDPDWQHARTWVVYDRGGDNQRLLRTAPDRIPYLYDEDSGTIRRLP